MKFIKSIISCLKYKLPNSIWEISEIKESNNNKIYLIWNIVLKISKNNSNLSLEWLILKSIQNIINVPKPIFYEKIKINNEYLYILWIEKLNWKSLDHYWEKYNIYIKQSIINSIINNLKKIHSFKKNYFCYFGKKNKHFLNYFSLISDNIDENLKLSIWNPWIKTESLQNLKKYFYSLWNTFYNEVPVIIHNDLWYKNILVNENGFVWIIDFESVVYAPKQIEIFRLYHHLFSAQNYIDKWSVEYTEINFLNMLIYNIKNNYPELHNSFSEQQFVQYNIWYYINLLTKFKNSWYNHSDTEKFYKTFLGKITIL